MSIFCRLTKNQSNPRSSNSDIRRNHLRKLIIYIVHSMLISNESLTVSTFILEEQARYPCRKKIAFQILAVPRERDFATRRARPLIPRARRLFIFSRGVFFLNILARGYTRTNGRTDGRAGRRRAASQAARRGGTPVSMSLFAFCLPAEHRGVSRVSRGAIEPETYRRRTPNRPRTQRATTQSPVPASRPFLPLAILTPPASGRRYEKG